MDSDDTELNLWVTDPFGETCYYGNMETRVGGVITTDWESGYGPEVFLLKHAFPGVYRVEVEYYGNYQQILSAAPTLHVDIIIDFGRPTEHRRSVTLRPENLDDVVFVGEIVIPER